MNVAKSLSLLNSIEFLIRIEKGPDAGKTFRIYPPKIEIGRDPSLQIVITDPKASRKQCSIIIKDDVLIKDESSRQTTLVNGQKFKEHLLKPGDIISFGETQIKFLARSLAPKPKAAASIAGQVAKNPISVEKQQARKRFHLFLGIIFILVVGLFFMEETVPIAEEQLVTKDQLVKQVEDSETRQTDFKETFKERNKSEEKRYLFSVENHFIKGFRDLQTGNYSRAIHSFGTTLASDRNHQRALQYSKIAKKKRMDLIDTLMRDGIKYKEKVMYKRCMAEFRKAIVLINNKNDQKHKIAQTQREECRLLRSGGR